LTGKTADEEHEGRIACCSGADDHKVERVGAVRVFSDMAELPALLSGHGLQET
jgi:hypothetical protein